MSEAKPVRLQLSRRKGFSLQALSRATNGLEAVNCARPSKRGNRWKIGSDHPNRHNNPIAYPITREEAVALHRAETEAYLAANPHYLDDLRGKNLACHCGPDDLCHVDTYLALANPPGKT